VLAFPERSAELSHRLAQLLGVEVHAVENSRIVIVLEGASADEIGERMIQISLMDGVIAANLVFETFDDGVAST